MPLLGNVHLDGDVAGRGLLAWTGLRGSTFVAQATSVRNGRRADRVRDLWRTHASVAVEDVDVAASGAAAVCLRERPRRDSDAWRVRVITRSAARSWSHAVLVATPRRYLDDVDCAVDDAGNVVLAWREGIGARLRAAAVTNAGKVGTAVTLGQRPEPPEVEMAPDGSAVVAFATEIPEKRHLHVAEYRPGTGWSPAVQVPLDDETVQGPELAVDGTGRRLLAWNGGAGPVALRLATGTATTLAPSTLLTGDVALTSLTAGSGGDALVTFQTHPSSVDGASMLRAIVQRPRAAFGSPVTLGRFAAYPLQTALAGDGSGIAVWVAGSERRPRIVARSLRPDGRWSAPRQLSHTGEPIGLDIGVATAAGRPSTVAWTIGNFGGPKVRLRIASVD